MRAANLAMMSARLGAEEESLRESQKDVTSSALLLAQNSVPE